MKNYRDEIRKRAMFGLVGYKILNMLDGDKLMGTIAAHGAAKDVYEVKTPLGLKELDLSKYNHNIVGESRVIELYEKYNN